MNKYILNADGERDLLEESGRILRRETRLLTTSAHLEAVTQLVREAHAFLRNGYDHNALDAWLTEAEKVL